MSDGAWPTPPRDPGKTVAEWADVWGLTWNEAYSRLLSMVASRAADRINRDVRPQRWIVRT